MDELIRILIVDDETAICHMTKRILKTTGWKCQLEVAVEGGEAIQKIKSFKPDLILLDINLPGISGYGICSFLGSREKSKSPIILAMSGDGSEEIERQARQAGAVDLLKKPFTREELLEKLIKVCPLLEGKNPQD